MELGSDNRVAFGLVYFCPGTEFCKERFCSFGQLADVAFVLRQHADAGNIHQLFEIRFEGLF